MILYMWLFLRAPMIVIAMGITMARAQSLDRVADPMPPPASRPRAGDADQMPRVTNDTREYCEELRHDIARIRVRRGELPPEPAMLAREGERMCQMGHFRPGIYRLRTALMMLRP